VKDFEQSFSIQNYHLKEVENFLYSITMEEYIKKEKLCQE